MKRIILGLSLLLLLVQNGFAESDTEYNLHISQKKGWFKEVLKCEKEMYNHSDNGDVKACLMAIKLIERSLNKKNSMGV